MLTKSFVAAALALAVSAQTTTECSPLEKECPADAAVGKKGIDCDFTKGACDAFYHIAGKDVTYGSRGAVSELTAPRQAPTLESNAAFFFGRVEVEMQAAPGKGVVSCITLLSDDLDEIDLEAVGSDNAHIQSNTFSRGDDTVHDLLGLLPVDDMCGAVHKYAVDWTTERIEFYVDGKLERTMYRKDIPTRYPESPMRVKIGAWVAGFEGADPGTINWAGGKADFSNGPATAYYKSVKVTDYAGGSSATDKDVKEYSYGDRTGKSSSIVIHYADGSSSSSSSSSTATDKSSSTESSSTATTSATTSSKETATTEHSSTTTETKTHSSNSTLITKTPTGTGSGSSTQSASSTPSTAGGACLPIGATIAAAAALLAI